MKLIYEAASHLFINRGYPRTQMKDIAGEIGLSTGMLYVYFTGKRDILRFILKCTIQPAFLERDFAYPISGDLFDGLETEIMAAFEENNRRFAGHLSDMGSFPPERMLSDAFDVIARYGVGCLVIEKNPGDVGSLAEYYREYRRKFFGQILTCVEWYITEGIFRELSHPVYSTQLIVETLSWWGMHVMNDAFELQKDIPPATAKEVCLDNLLHAYCREP